MGEVDAGAFRKDVHQGYPVAADATSIDTPSSYDEKEAKLEDEGEEALFDSMPIPPWQQQVTIRALVVALLLGTFFSIVIHKLNFTVGIIPSLNIAAGLLGYFFVKIWVTGLSKLGIQSKPFTRQENTVIQTCVIACSGLAFSGGFGSYLLGMAHKTFDKVQKETATKGPNVNNRAQDVKDPQLGWMYAFMFLVSFTGILVMVPLRKIMILNYKLQYPSGTATGILINGFHTPTGAAKAVKQVKALASAMGGAFFWAFFKWFFGGSGDTTCGFDNFPTLGIKALKNKFMFDFNMTYVGAGMLVPHIINISVMLGAILSWGILWPIIRTKEGHWYFDKSSHSFKGIFGYQVFISIAIILGDGFYNLIKVAVLSAVAFYKHRRDADKIPDTMPKTVKLTAEDIDNKKREVSFLKDRISTKLALVAYVVLGVVAIIVLPFIFRPLKWYYVLMCYFMGPIMAFCNSYGAGLTDWSLASTYGKILLFVFAAWGGTNGGVIAGLAACGVMFNMVSTGADLMGDFRTGYLTRSSPRSMFVSQLIGTAFGCIIAPSTFWMFWKAFDVGSADGAYPAPFAAIYREMGVIGAEGFSALPHNCLTLCYIFFSVSVAVNIVRDLVPKRIGQYVPVPMAMAIPFYLGAYFAIDMMVGTLIKFWMEKTSKEAANTYVRPIASGLICGEGIWALPQAVLALFKVNPPICMTFYPSKVAEQVQATFSP